MKVRTAVSDDAAQIVEVMKDAEASNFMMYGPGEREMTAEQFQRFIDVMNGKEHSELFVAVEEDKILGYLIMQGEVKPKRVSHRVSVAIGVHSESRGKGVGKSLFEFAHRWAKEKEIHRVELTVISTNEQAYKLYEKMGYETEGVKKHSLFIDGAYADEYYMAKLL
ncbi:N-acetyltransferase family protein [Lysinibacillus sp. 3P01SB]|uniref:GNAT family N-acetyltransferase n=1 Tax=Lysinibacillus sp. 3P01SB TaxID=3132284 RepID=UPI0039A4E716